MRAFFEFLIHPSTLTFVLHLSLVVVFSIRVIMQRPATGVALAWLFLIAAIPFLGPFFYLLFGEKRVGAGRAKRLSQLRHAYARVTQGLISRNLTQIDWEKFPPEAREMDQLGQKLVGLPTVGGSGGRLYSDTREILDGIAEDVRQAKRSVLMEFYIWNEGGLADEVLEALVAAAQRGLDCRLLIDGLGAGPWWKGDQPERLRQAGVMVVKALPVGFIRMLVGRNDVRLHRKIVIIDGLTAWTGSMNMVDPRYFKQDANVGEWVDAMVRAKGGVVAPLALTLIGDLVLETDEDPVEVAKAVGFDDVVADGETAVQVVPSGPGQTDDGLLQMLLATVNAASRELVLTTPYFVPDDSLLRAIRGAAARGVSVSMIVPEKVDSLLSRYASRSFYDGLMDCGVKIHLYRAGLLHTKSVAADRQISMFGTVNLDMRSLWINYEVAAFVYGSEFGEQLFGLQQSYMEDSDLLDPVEWAKRSKYQMFLENVFRLASPLL